MLFSRVVPILPLATAFVITEPDIFLNVEKSRKQLVDNAHTVVDNAHTVVDNAQNVLDDAFGRIKDGYSKIQHAGCDVESWLEGSQFDDSIINFENPDHPPHHPPHDQKPNRTVYELINESKYTTKLAKWINEFDDVVQLLNSTKANYTVFAPTDEAFEKIPEHHHKPSKEVLKDILLYHVTDDLYPAGRVLHTYTIPTLFTPSKNLGHQQRLTVRVTLKGPAINFYSRLVAVNIFGTNGVIHGVDSILVPPPNVVSIIDLLPGEFSTLELGLGKTGLFDKINSTEYEHNGGTFFAPSNFAFQKLGGRANAFLFSKYGEKYLKALLEYHMVVDQTLYSDAFYDGRKDDKETVEERPGGYHYDLPTVLCHKSLAVDVGRYGPFVEIRINGFSRVTIHDGVASDGVIQVVSNVLIPPKTSGGEQIFWKGEELDVEDLKDRLQPFVENMEL